MLFRLSIACTLLGLVALFVISETVGSGEASIKDIDSSFLDRKVSVSGAVTSVNEKESLWMIELGGDNSTIDVVVFKGGNAYMHEESLDGSAFEPGNFIEVEGLVSEWHGSLQITASTVRFK